jgi:hypothetical protein
MADLLMQTGEFVVIDDFGADEPESKDLPEPAEEPESEETVKEESAAPKKPRAGR